MQVKAAAAAAAAAAYVMNEAAVYAGAQVIRWKSHQDPSDYSEQIRAIDQPRMLIHMLSA